MLFFALAIFLFAFLSTADSAVKAIRLSPSYQHAFQYPLPISPVKKPITSYTNPATGASIDFYEVEVKSFKQKFFLDLPGEGDLFGYDGLFPGPTFRIEKGRETVVRFVNKGSKAMNVHLHGSYSRSPWDGWAMDWIEPGQYKDYYYPNAVHRTLWYHDHTNKLGAVNAYKGLVGMYQIIDSKLDSTLGLPSGGNYDVPLVLTSHYFTKDGGMSDERRQQSSIYGDTYLVNGQIQPYLAVEPRKYRFRILNAAISRVFNLTLLDGTTTLPMSIIGSDGGYRQTPSTTKNLMIGMADRWEIILDFSGFSGKNLTLQTTNAWTDTAYSDVDQMMRFVVGKNVSDQTGNSPLPRRFNFNMKFSTETKIAAERVFKLDSHHSDTVWGINGIHHDDAMSRVMMRPPLGTIEKYTFKSSGHGQAMAASSADPTLNPNFSGGHHGMSGMRVRSAPSKKEISDFEKRQMDGMMMGSGGSGGMTMGGSGMSKGDGAWTHAMHVHLVDMKMISRRKDNPSKPEGRDFLEEYERDAVKDVVLLGSNEVVEVLAKFAPFPGVYMFHCHNSVHSDQGMMAVLNVTRLADLGYSDLETKLEDPMDPRFRAKKYTGTDLEEIKFKTLPFFASLKAYPDVTALSAAEDKYWSGRTPPSGAETMGNMGNEGPSKNGGMNMGGSGMNMGGSGISMGGGNANMAGLQMGPKTSSGETKSIPTPSAPAPKMEGMGNMAGHHGAPGTMASPSAAKPIPSASGSEMPSGNMMAGHHGGGMGMVIRPGFHGA